VQPRLGFFSAFVRLQMGNHPIQFFVRKLGVAINAEEISQLRRGLGFQLRAKQIEYAPHLPKTLGGGAKFHRFGII
jgi:hypothetical protein